MPLPFESAGCLVVWRHTFDVCVSARNQAFASRLGHARVNSLRIFVGAVDDQTRFGGSQAALRQKGATLKNLVGRFLHFERGLQSTESVIRETLATWGATLYLADGLPVLEPVDGWRRRSRDVTVKFEAIVLGHNDLSGWRLVHSEQAFGLLPAAFVVRHTGTVADLAAGDQLFVMTARRVGLNGKQDH